MKLSSIVVHRVHLAMFGLLFMTGLSGCHRPDPRTVEGALDMALAAVGRADTAKLFKVIDQRARHAMFSIVADRRSSAERVRAIYPAAEQGAALAALGDAAQVQSASELFQKRCRRACLASLRERLGGVRGTAPMGDIVRVTTTRGGTIDLYHGSDTWYGIVWQTDELSRERDRAAAELESVMRNAALYEARQKLE